MIGPNRVCRSAVPVTPGTLVSPGDRAWIVASGAGTQNIKLAGGSIVPVPVAVGLTVLSDVAVVDAPVGGTATATVYVLS